MNWFSVTFCLCISPSTESGELRADSNWDMDVAELSMFLDTLGMGKGTQSDIEFENAANSVKNMKDLDDVQRLQLYGLYKQGTVGDINCNVPSASDVVGTAKW